jgi:hypothetical protein
VQVLPEAEISLEYNLLPCLVNILAMEAETFQKEVAYSFWARAKQELLQEGKLMATHQLCTQGILRLTLAPAALAAATVPSLLPPSTTTTSRMQFPALHTLMEAATGRG